MNCKVFHSSEEGASGTSHGHVEDPSPGAGLIRDTRHWSVGGILNTLSIEDGLGYTNKAVGKEKEEVDNEKGLSNTQTRSYGQSTVTKVKNKRPLISSFSQILFIFMMLTPGAKGNGYEVRGAKHSFISPNESLRITENVSFPNDGCYLYVFANVGNTEYTCSKKYAEENAPTCKRFQPSTSTSCEGWHNINDAGTWYLALKESEMPDGGQLQYCIYQAVPGNFILYQGLVARKSVNGSWGAWSSWNNCSAPCDGFHTRTRTCSNPAPMYGGSDCSGKSWEVQSCNNNCPINGSWGAWSSWNNCSAPCDGFHTRTRTCSNPAPMYGGSDCSGKSWEVQSCNNNCPNHLRITMPVIIVVLLLIPIVLICLFIYWYCYKKKGNEGTSGPSRTQAGYTPASGGDDSVLVSFNGEAGQPNGAI